MRGVSLGLEAIDLANAADPHLVEWQGALHPRAQLQGILASHWLKRLSPSPSPAVEIAARAHHLERWAIARDSYPAGRSGYLRWRAALKKHHAEALARVLTPVGVDRLVLARAQELVQRAGLGRDPDAQLIEDVACLVFVETDFAALASRLDHDKLVNAVQKTVKKMSADAVALTAETRIADAARAALAQALAG